MCQHPGDRTMPPRSRGHLAKEGDMTVLMIAVWLSLQIPAGILVGRLLQRSLVLLPIASGRSAGRLLR